VDANSSRLLTSFWFEVSLIRSGAVVAGSQRSLADSSDAPAPPAHVVGDGAFQECSGLEIEMDVQEYQEGGRNNGVVRRVGRAKVAPIVLKRGMFYAGPADSRADDTLWAWMQSILNDVRPVPRYDGLIHVMSGDRTVRLNAVRALAVSEDPNTRQLLSPLFERKGGEFAELRMAVFSGAQGGVARCGGVDDVPIVHLQCGREPCEGEGRDPRQQDRLRRALRANRIHQRLQLSLPARPVTGRSIRREEDAWEGLERLRAQRPESRRHIGSG